jgi:hypothetical protein
MREHAGRRKTSAGTAYYQWPVALGFGRKSGLKLSPNPDCKGGNTPYVRGCILAYGSDFRFVAPRPRRDAFSENSAIWGRGRRVRPVDFGEFERQEVILRGLAKISCETDS